MAHDFLRHLRPAPQQTALIKAALLEGDPARIAHREWRRTADLDQLDFASFRLLPLLAANLNRLGLTDPDMPRLRGIRRRQFYRNRMLIHAAIPLLKRFTTAGIPALLLKGSAICTTVRPDWSLRFLFDVDVMVPLPRALEAWQEIQRAGWSPMVPRDAADLEATLRFRHASGFSTPQGAQLDMHWRALCQRERPEQEAAFWRDAVAIDSADIPARVLNPGHQLFHVLAHAALRPTGKALEWITDAHAILTHPATSVAWEELIHFAHERVIARTIAEQLRWLSDELGAPVPLAVIEELAAAPWCLGEAGLNWSSENTLPKLRLVCSLWHDHLDHTVIARTAAVGRKAAWTVGVPLWLLPLAAVVRPLVSRKAWRRLKRRW